MRTNSMPVAIVPPLVERDVARQQQSLYSGPVAREEELYLEIERLSARLGEPATPEHERESLRSRLASLDAALQHELGASGGGTYRAADNSLFTLAGDYLHIVSAVDGSETAVPLASLLAYIRFLGRA